MDRRSYVKTLGAAAALTSTWVVGRTRPKRGPAVDEPPGASVDPERPAPPTVDAQPAIFDRFHSVRDIGNAEIDDTGREPVDALLQELGGDDTLLWFPAGRYRVDGVHFDGLTNFGMVGEGATFVPGRPGANIFLRFSRVADVLVDGFEVDSTAANTAAWLDFRCVGGENVIRDYTVRGFGDVDERTNGFTLMVEGGDTSLLVERADLGDGSKNGAATFVFPRKSFTDPSRAAGTLEFRDCRMVGWGKEGLYASAHSGPLRVVGGEYANNAIVQVRIGGGNAPARAVVEGVRVRIEDPPAYIAESNRVFRGIWLKEGDLARVEDCDVVLGPAEHGNVRGGITVNDQFGRATIRNCRVRMRGASPAVVIEPPLQEFDPDAAEMPSLDRRPPAWTVDCIGLDIEGTAAPGEAIALHGRPNCRFRDVTIVQTHADADGIYAVDAPGCVVSSGSIVVPRYPGVVVTTDATDGGCQLELDGVKRFEGSALEEFGQPLAENHREATATAGPSTVTDPGAYCLDSRVVEQLVQQEDDALALTRTSDGTLFGKVVTYPDELGQRNRR